MTIVISSCSASQLPAAQLLLAAPTLTVEEKAGAQVYSRSCAPCHLLTPGDIKVGPSFYGIADRAGHRVDGQDAQTYLLMSILNPSEYLVDEFENVMPQGLAKTLTSEELDAVVAYLLTLRE